ncbi:MAG: hypothetical protein H5T69_18395 [Chloroflexi bacterium]|nr:hypothetical protein [Chloroflexota bacterium]
MRNCDRVRATLAFERVDRLPCTEWAPWWDQTIYRWREEGLPARFPVGREGMVAIQEWLGLDLMYQINIRSTADSYPQVPHGQGLVSDVASYEALRDHLYPEIDWETMIPDWVRRRHAKGELAVWLTVEGFFWWPRRLFGIERHFYAFYDQPELMKRINEDQVAFIKRVFCQATDILVPEFMTFAEDMSYNHGPMLSEETFNEFEAPYFREVVPLIKSRGVIPIVDSDGNIESCVPWFLACGLEGILPLERQSGVDVARLRRNHPTLRLVGGFDKMTMNRGTEAMRAEWERLLPVMRQGGFIPGCDHQTPPGVSLAQYRDYMSLMFEYAERGAEGEARR